APFLERPARPASPVFDRHGGVPETSDALYLTPPLVDLEAAEAVLESAEWAAEAAGIDDTELIRAAAGAAAQGIYQAGLLLAAENEDDEHHAFALKYRLFESGRWPIGVVGNSFHIF
ncbi:MAG: hypothetical protein QGF20_11140, partial [Alphaproteobacteria bacterium]|nr:hypothetical protein [Alphaproteobacteria bacterium]